jgi:D-3-phosphoglycerate dehydrogenase
VIDLNAVKQSIGNNHLRGFAVDVFPEEPKDNNETFTSTMQGLKNVILTPHIGGSTQEAQENIGLDVANKLISFLETGSTTGSLSRQTINGVALCVSKVSSWEAMVRL